MTLFRRRLQETGKELSYEAAKMALDSAGLTRKDIDMVVHGTAPDAFDGVHMKGEYLLDGSGGYRKPYTRVFTGGGTGVFSTIAGWWHVASGLADAVLVVNEEKMSSCQPHPQSVFAHIWDPILDRPLRPNLVWIFAMEMNRYMHVHGVKKEDIARVAVKNKRNAVGHPCAQLADPNITVDDVLNSEVMAWPVQRLDISPPSDGASAVVLASEDFIRRRKIRDRGRRSISRSLTTRSTTRSCTTSRACSSRRRARPRSSRGRGSRSGTASFPCVRPAACWGSATRSPRRWA
jgi:acetyl-CoA C-acetyltransferase